MPGAPARQLDWFQSITTVQYGGEKRWEEYRKKVGPQCDRESEDETADILGFQEPDRYPTAVFVPSEVRGLSFPLPQTGSASFELVGDLTVRDATQRVTWEATATFTGQDISVRASTAFRFEDFGLSIPRVASVLSVEDNIRLETDLLLRRSS